MSIGDDLSTSYEGELIGEFAKDSLPKFYHKESTTQS